MEQAPPPDVAPENVPPEAIILGKVVALCRATEDAIRELNIDLRYEAQAMNKMEECFMWAQQGLLITRDRQQSEKNKPDIKIASVADIPKTVQ